MHVNELKYNTFMDARYTDGTYLADNPTWHAEDAPWKLSHVLRALQDARIDLFTSVCDLGCGSGALVKTWAHMKPEISFTGYDVSPQALALCRQNAPKNTTFVTGNTLPVGPYQVVLALDVIEHIPDNESWLARAASAGDVLVLHVPLQLSFYTWLRPAWLQQERERVGHVHFYTVCSFKKSLKRQPLQILSWHYTNKYIECPQPLPHLHSKIGMCIRKVLHAVLPTAWVAWLVGGYSVMCVVKKTNGPASEAV